MKSQITFLLNRLKERLWVKPLLLCMLSIGSVLLASKADDVALEFKLPDISQESLEALLTIISASMLGIAVFAVGSMLSAYASASNSSTPRSFPVVIADDASQNALSIFVGAFIFSIVALTTLMNGYYETAGRFVLFVLTCVVFAVVILGFLRWVDSIARLGRLGTTIKKVEAVTTSALLCNRKEPTLGGVKSDKELQRKAVYGDSVGYVQQIDMKALQKAAEKNDITISVIALPGLFIMPGQPLAYLSSDEYEDGMDGNCVVKAFRIGTERTFDEDPRFGLVVLSEIASRALSPAVNDPGTAVGIIRSYIRLFTLWAKEPKPSEDEAPLYDRVYVPEVLIDDMFDDAFNAISRDGAGTVEVMLALQQAFDSLAYIDNKAMIATCESHSKRAFKYAEEALKLDEEVKKLRKIRENT